MRKFSFIISAAILLFGAASCQKGPDEGPKGKGNLTVFYGFDHVNAKNPGAPGTCAYTPSTNKPQTTWAENVKSLALFLVEGGTVKAAMSIPHTKSSDNAKQQFTFQNVPAGNYTGYLIANFDQSTINSNFSATTTNVPIASLLMKLVENASWTERQTPGEASVKAYNEPAEIFLASQTVTVTANQNNTVSTPFELTRAISLMRFRINNDHQLTTNGKRVDNKTVVFDDKASVRVRKSGTALNYQGAVTPGGNADLIYSKGFNKTPTAPTNYKDNTPLWTGTEFCAWKDVRIFPGGGYGPTEGDKKFNIVVAGTAPIGYIPSGETDGLTAPKLVYWQGTVDKVIAANGILELDIDLITQGSTTITDPVPTGSINISVNLVEWGSIDSTNIDM